MLPGVKGDIFIKHLVILNLFRIFITNNNNMKKSELRQIIREELKNSSKNRSDIKKTEAAKRAEWKARYGSMDGFDKAYPL